MNTLVAKVVPEGSIEVVSASLLLEMKAKAKLLPREEARALRREFRDELRGKFAHLIEVYVLMFPKLRGAPILMFNRQYEMIGKLGTGWAEALRDISVVTLFLLSERSSFISGQTLVADGGRVTLP